MQKKLPMRMCVGCREMKPKRELVRVVCSRADDESMPPIISVDFTGKVAGRGAYVCPSKKCLERAVKSRALDRAFSTKISDEVLDVLKSAVDEAEKCTEE